MNFFAENLKDGLVRKVLVPVLEGLAHILFWAALPVLKFSEIRKIKKEKKGEKND